MLAAALTLSLPAAAAFGFGHGGGGFARGSHGGGGFGMERGGSGFDRGRARAFGNEHFDREGHPFRGGDPFYSPWLEGGYYDSYCSPVSPYYDPPACRAYYGDR